MWNLGLASNNTLVYRHGMCADQMMIKCSHAEGCKPHFLACMEHMAALKFSLYLYFFGQRFIDWICWMYVLAWGIWKCSVLWSFIAQSMKLTGNRCIYVLHLSDGNVWKGQVYLDYRLTLQLGHLFCWAGWGAMVCSAGQYMHFV